MWIKCQDGTLVNTNQFDVISVFTMPKTQAIKVVAVRDAGIEVIEHVETICSCSTKEEAEQLRDDIYDAINAGRLGYSVLAEDN